MTLLSCVLKRWGASMTTQQAEQIGALSSMHAPYQQPWHCMTLQKGLKYIEVEVWTHKAIAWHSMLIQQ